MRLGSEHTKMQRYLCTFANQHEEQQAKLPRDFRCCQLVSASGMLEPGLLTLESVPLVAEHLRRRS